MKKWLISAIMGLLAFLAVNSLSAYTGVSLIPNGINLMGAAALGLPGVIGLTLLNYLL